MPQHVRAQIRAAVMAALEAAGTPAGSRVYAHRADPTRVDALPALQVEDAGESIEVPEMARPAPYMERTLRVRVIAQALSVDLVDELLGHVEQCFSVQKGFGIGQYNTPRQATDVDVSGELHKTVYARAMVFELAYATSQGNPWVTA